MTDKATWQFPPNSGGIDVIQDSSSFHFSDAPIANVVREVIQNSLDAREGGLDRVTVKFIEESVNPSLVGGYQLIHHLTQCLARARQEERLSIQAVYERALQTASRDSLRCLKIQDTGTTGLKDTKWDALVLQEGSVKKNSGTIVPGGSYGIGKNAVLNVSDLMTVFYSTRYVQGRKGRVEKLQGKATLMTHQNPQEATGHLGITLSFRIATPNGSPSRLGAAALVLCASTVGVIREWLQENPDDAAAIEKSINDFLSSARLHEDDFNARTAEENRKTVTTSWTNPPKAPPTKGKLPADATYGLNILCQAAEEELTAIQQDEQDIYYHDTHYDAHLTWLWARLMQQQLAQLTTSGRTQECAHPEPVEQMIY